MQYWINAGFLEVDQLIPVAHAAEQLGYEGVTLPDHLVLPEVFDSMYPYSANGDITWPREAPWPDCWVAIAAMAAATTRLRFATSVFIGPLRHTLSLAKAVGTCAAFAPGRVLCGLGAGWLREEFEIHDQDFGARGRRLDEMIEALPRLWSGEMVDYSGEHVSFPAVQMRPTAGTVPILIGGNSRPALRRAAKADGWIGAFTDIDDTTQMLAEYATQRSRQGRAEKPAEVLLTGTPGIAKHAQTLSGLGVDGVVVPAAALAATTATDDVVAGLERYAERWQSTRVDDCVK